MKNAPEISKFMHQFVRNLRPSHFKLVQHAASQIAGRKPRRHAPDFKINEKERHRGRLSPYKDIAGCTQDQLAAWIKEDGHTVQKGGSLAQAFQKTVHVMHSRRGGSFDLSDLHVGKIDKVLGNMANTARVQVDVGADDFLNRIGLRHERKYKSGEITQNFKNHAKIHKDAYKSLESREGTETHEYLREHSTDKYATYKDKASGKVVVAFRGTSPAKAAMNNDLVEDAHIAAGEIHKSSDYGSYKQHIKNMINQYGDGNVSLSGYSLGGAKVEALMQDKDIRSGLGQAVSIAGGASPLDKQLQQKSEDTKISHIYGHNDGVANAKLQHSGSHHTVLYDEANPIKAHTLLDRLASA